MNNLEKCLAKLYKTVEEELSKCGISQDEKQEDKIPFYISQYKKEKYKIEQRNNQNQVIEEKKSTKNKEPQEKVEIKWYRVKKNVKINRLYKFLDQQKNENELSDDIFDKIQTELIFMFKDKQIKNTDVVYNTEEEKIISVNQYDELLEKYLS
jgi:hypothetical protein